MKEKIIQIIGAGMEPERAELKASEIIINFNSHIIAALKEMKSSDLTEFIDKIFIKL
jgi:hypothetical protein